MLLLTLKCKRRKKNRGVTISEDDKMPLFSLKYEKLRGKLKY